MLANYLKVTVGDRFYFLENYNEEQIIDTSIIKKSNRIGYLLQQRIKNCNDENRVGRSQNLMKSTKTSVTTGDSVFTSNWRWFHVY